MWTRVPNWMSRRRNTESSVEKDPSSSWIRASSSLPGVPQRQTQAEAVIIDFVDLYNFEVQILWSSEDESVSFLDQDSIKDVVRDWFYQSFQDQLVDADLIGGYSSNNYATLDSIILIPNDSLVPDEEEPGQNSSFGQLTTTQFQGAVLLERAPSQKPIPEPLILKMQQISLQEEDEDLLELVRQEVAAVSSSEGTTGATVLDVRAYLLETSSGSSPGSNNDSLEIVIMVAVAVAAVAFLFLLFAIYWAWSYDKRNRDAYLANPSSKNNGPDKTGSESAPAETQEDESLGGYPSQIGGSVMLGQRGAYADSVMTDDIEEDIRTSLEAYRHMKGSGSVADSTLYTATYKEGKTQSSAKYDDNASVSSIGSYGFSLDGQSLIHSTLNGPKNEVSLLGGNNTVSSGEDQPLESLASTTRRKQDP